MGSNTAADFIQVVVRIRPKIKREIKKGQNDHWGYKGNEVFQLDENGRASQDCFTFDYVFGTESKNTDLHRVVSPIVQQAMQGINGTVFAYGQTSSGKTHSIMGKEEDIGIIPQAIDDIFSHIENDNTNRKFLIRASYYEIHNEKINDLLNINAKDLKIREDIMGNVGVKGTEEITRTRDELLRVVHAGNKKRQSGETCMNERSSRSHAIFQIIIESSEQMQGDNQDTPVQVSSLYLVDLAGSERVAQTKATGARLKEGGHINKSLSVLSLVMQQLSSKQEHISFRDSKLTRILSNALGGNSKTLIIATITPVSIENTLSTLMFAKCAKTIMNQPHVNEILTEAALIKQHQQKEKVLLQELQNEKEKNSTLQMDKHKQEERIKSLEEKLRNIRQDFVSIKPVPVSKIPKRRHTSAFEKPKEPAPTENIKLSSIFENEDIFEDALLDRANTPELVKNSFEIPSTPVSVLKSRYDSLDISFLQLKEYHSDELRVAQEHEKELSLENKRIKDQLKRAKEEQTIYENLLKEFRQQYEKRDITCSEVEIELDFLTKKYANREQELLKKLTEQTNLNEKYKELESEMYAMKREREYMLEIKKCADHLKLELETLEKESTDLKEQRDQLMNDYSVLKEEHMFTVSKKQLFMKQVELLTRGACSGERYGLQRTSSDSAIYEKADAQVYSKANLLLERKNESIIDNELIEFKQDLCSLKTIISSRSIEEVSTSSNSFHLQGNGDTISIREDLKVIREKCKKVRNFPETIEDLDYFRIINERYISECQRLEGVIKELDMKVKAQDQEILNLNEAIKENHIKKSDHGVFLEQHKVQLNSESEKCQELEKEMSKQCDEIKDLTSSVQKLNDNIEEMQNSIDQKNLEIQRLTQEHLAEVKDLTLTIQKLTNNVEERQTAINQKCSDIQKLKQDHLAEMTFMKKTVNENGLAFEEANAKINAMTSTLQSKEEELVHLMRRLRQSDESKDKVEKEMLKKFKIKFEEARTEIDEMSGDLMDKISLIEKLEESLKRSQEDVEQIKIELKSSEQNLQDSKEEQKLTKERLRIAQEINEKNSQDKMEELQEELKQSQNEYLRILQQLQESQVDVENYKNLQGNHEEVLQDYRSKFEKLQENLTQAQKDLHQAVVASENLKKTQDVLEKARIDLEQSLVEAANYKTLHETQEALLHESQSNLTKLQDSLKQAHKDLTNSQEEVQKERECFKQLQIEIEQLRLELQAKKVDESEEIKLIENLKEAQLEIQQSRVLQMKLLNDVGTLEQQANHKLKLEQEIETLKKALDVKETHKEEMRANLAEVNVKFDKMQKLLEQQKHKSEKDTNILQDMLKLKDKLLEEQKEAFDKLQDNLREEKDQTIKEMQEKIKKDQALLVALYQDIEHLQKELEDKEMLLKEEILKMENCNCRVIRLNINKNRLEDKDLIEEQEPHQTSLEENRVLREVEQKQENGHSAEKEGQIESLHENQDLSEKIQEKAEIILKEQANTLQNSLDKLQEEDDMIIKATEKKLQKLLERVQELELLPNILVDKETAMKKLEEKLQEQQKLLDGVQELDHLQNTLVNKETELKQLEEKLQVREQLLERVQELELLPNILGDKESEMKQLEQKLQDHQKLLERVQELELLPNIVVDKETAMKQLEEQLQDQQKLLERVQNTLVNKETELKQLEEKLQDHEKLLLRVQELELLPRILVDKETTMKQLEEKLQKQQKLVDKVQELEHIQNILVNKERELKQLEEKLQDHEKLLERVQELELLPRILVDKETTMKQLEEKLQKQQKLVDKVQELEHIQNILVNKERELKQLEEKLQDHEKLLERVQELELLPNILVDKETAMKQLEEKLQDHEKLLLRVQGLELLPSLLVDKETTMKQLEEKLQEQQKFVDKVQELEHLQNILVDKERELKQLEEKLQDHEKLLERVQELELLPNILVDKESEVKQLEHNILGYQKYNQQLQVRVDELELCLEKNKKLLKERIEELENLKNKVNVQGDQTQNLTDLQEMNGKLMVRIQELEPYLDINKHLLEKVKGLEPYLVKNSQLLERNQLLEQHLLQSKEIERDQRNTREANLELQRQLFLCSKQINELNKKNMQLSNRRESPRETELTTKCDELVQMNLTLQQQVQSANQNLEKVREEGSALIKDLSNLKASETLAIQEKKVMKKRLQGILVEKSKVEAAMTMRLAELKAEEKEKVAALEKHLLYMKDESNQLKTEIDSLRISKQQLKSDISYHLEIISGYEVYLINAIEGKFEASNPSLNEKAESVQQRKFKEIKTRLNEILQKNVESQHTNSMCSDQTIEALKKDLLKKRVEVEALKQDKETLNLKIAGFLEIVENQKKEMEELKEKMQELTSDNEHLDNEVLGALDRIKSLEATQDDLTKDIKQKDGLIKELQKNRDSPKSLLDNEALGALNVNKSLDANQADLIKEIKEKDGLIKLLQKNKDSTKGFLEIVENQKKEMEELKEKMQELTSDNEHLDNEVLGALDRIKSLEATQDDLTKDIKQKDGLIKELQKNRDSPKGLLDNEVLGALNVNKSLDANQADLIKEIKEKDGLIKLLQKNKDSTKVSGCTNCISLKLKINSMQKMKLQPEVKCVPQAPTLKQEECSECKILQQVNKELLTKCTKLQEEVEKSNTQQLTELENLRIKYNSLSGLAVLRMEKLKTVVKLFEKEGFKVLNLDQSLGDIKISRNPLRNSSLVENNQNPLDGPFNLDKARSVGNIPFPFPSKFIKTLPPPSATNVKPLTLSDQVRSRRAVYQISDTNSQNELSGTSASNSGI